MRKYFKINGNTIHDLEYRKVLDDVELKQHEDHFSVNSEMIRGIKLYSHLSIE